MKNVLYLFLFFILISSNSNARDLTSEADLRVFANEVYRNIQTRYDCGFTMELGGFVNPSNITEKIKKKRPNLIEEYGVRFHRECGGVPKEELTMTWKIEKIEDICVAGTIVNNHRDVQLDKEFSIEFCSLQNYLQLSNLGSLNPWWKWIAAVAQDNSNWN